MEENKMEENKMEENKMEENKMEEKKMDENKMEENKIKVEIANMFGHQELMLNEEQTREIIDENPEHWVFVDNMMVSREHVKAIEFDNVIHIRLMPALVGGSTTKKEQEKDTLGMFKHFRHDGLPGHNASLRWLNEICNSIDAEVNYNHNMYNGRKSKHPKEAENNDMEIIFEGKSGTIYCVKVQFSSFAADALATKVEESKIFSDWFERHDLHETYTLWGKRSKGRVNDSEEEHEINRWSSGKELFKAVELFTFTVHYFSFIKGDWDSICISPRNRIEHDADAVAALLCALENDVVSAKISEMNTLRTALLDNLLQNWIFNVKPTLNWEQTSEVFKDLVAIGQGRKLEYGEDEVGGFLSPA